MTDLRIVADDVIELGGVSVGKLLPGLKPSLRDELTALFDAIDEGYVARLEDRIEQLEAWLKEPAR